MLSKLVQATNQRVTMPLVTTFCMVCKVCCSFYIVFKLSIEELHVLVEEIMLLLAGTLLTLGLTAIVAGPGMRVAWPELERRLSFLGDTNDDLRW